MCVTVTKVRAIKTSTPKTNNQHKLSNQSTKTKVTQNDLSFKWS